MLAGAVGMVVNGFVSDIMMPIVGHFAGGVDFADMKIVLSLAVLAADGTLSKPENAIMYRKWVNAILNLVIVGFVLFIIVRAYNKTKTPVVTVLEAPKGPTAEELLAEIRDALKK